MKHYKAPWSLSLTIVSALATAFCLGLPLFIGCVAKPNDPVIIVTGLLLLILVLSCTLFTIRGYTITDDAILVHRLFWATRLERAGLRWARSDPSAMRWSIRIFGNGGLFSFSGFFWNKRLGIFRAFVTDQKRAVVLRDAKRTVVISPDAPEDFVRELALPNSEA